MSSHESPHIPKLRERNRSVRQGRFLYEDAAWMREAYLDRRLTLRQMAHEAECSLRTIARWMDNHGIPTDRSRIGNRTRGANAHQWKGGPQPCPSCGGPKTFYAKSCARCQDKTGANNPKSALRRRRHLRRHAPASRRGPRAT